MLLNSSLHRNACKTGPVRWEWLLGCKDFLGSPKHLRLDASAATVRFIRQDAGFSRVICPCSGWIGGSKNNIC